MTTIKKRTRSLSKRLKMAVTASMFSVIYAWCITIMLMVFHLVCPYEHYLTLDDYLPSTTSIALIKHKRGFWRFIAKSASKNSSWGKFLEMVMVGTETFVFYWKEIFIVVALYFIMHLLSGSIYVQMPPWLQGIISSISPSDDSEPPPLEDLSYCQPELDTKNQVENEGKRNGNVHKGKDWLVYDPIFGVIPKETKDLWESQGQERNDEYNRMIYLSRRRTLPPVRGASEQPDQKS